MFFARRVAKLLLVTSMLLLLAACGGQEEPTPTATATIAVAPTATMEATTAPPTVEAAPEGAAPEQAAEEAWTRVQTQGKLVVGTSVDYPPFEYFDSEYRVDGFDIRLIEGIAKQMGVELELRDIAFDGLGSALRLGQVDAAIAAISLTPDRDEVLDFSNIYFVTSDAYLAAANFSLGPIRSVEDLAPFRVGVQRASIYEDWLEDELIETGLMPATNLFVYSQIEGGYPDLQAGRVDLLVMDLPVAEVAVQEQGFSLAGQGVNIERYAIAVNHGERTLQEEINRALITMQDAGVVNDLVKEYLDLELDEIAVLPTPAPTSPAVVPPPPLPGGCADGMAWVADLNYDDQGMAAPPVFQPGQPFSKGWRIQNVGTCTWDANYRLAFVQGNSPASSMGGQPTAIQGSVGPGQTYDIYVDLISPLQPGVYQGVWQMLNSQGGSFGERVWVGIQVPAGPVPTLMPTQTPSPNINFTVDRTSIKRGECVTFSWDVSNVREVYFYAEGQDWSKNGVSGQGSRQECPSQTTTYYLRVVNQSGSVETRQITIQVQATDAPSIVQFTLDPGGQISAGGCLTIRWDVQGNVDRVNIIRNGNSVWENAPFRGSTQDCPPGTGNKEYLLEAIGPGGNSRATQNVSVVETAATATPIPTSAPQAVIDAFTVNPTQINVDQCVILAWSTSGGTSSVRVLRNGGVVQDGANLSGSIQDCPGQAGAITYSLQASNRVGQMVSRDATLQVDAPQATPTPAPQPPTIDGFSASPTEFKPNNLCTNLKWSISGSGLAAVTLTRNGQQIAGPDASSPTQDCVDAGLAGQDVIYELKADAEFGGSAVEQLVVPFPGG